MAFCTKCGEDIKNYKFCPNCGTKNVLNNKINKTIEQKSIAKKQVMKVKNVSLNDKLLSSLSYIGPCSLFIYFKKGKTKFLKFHNIEGIKLFFVQMLYLIISIFLSLIKVKKIIFQQGSVIWTKMVTPWYIFLIIYVFGILIITLSIIGIVNALNKEKQELPLINKIKILKKINCLL